MWLTPVTEDLDELANFKLLLVGFFVFGQVTRFLASQLKEVSLADLEGLSILKHVSTTVRIYMSAFNQHGDLNQQTHQVPNQSCQSLWLVVSFPVVGPCFGIWLIFQPQAFGRFKYIARKTFRARRDGGLAATLSLSLSRCVFRKREVDGGRWPQSKHVICTWGLEGADKTEVVKGREAPMQPHAACRARTVCTITLKADSLKSTKTRPSSFVLVFAGTLPSHLVFLPVSPFTLPIQREFPTSLCSGNP